MVDEIDRKILKRLSEDARLSYRQLAKELGISVATAAAHVTRLEKEGIIQGYFAKLNYEKLGFGFPVIIEVKVAHGKLFEVERKLAKDPHVTIVLDHTGGTDATLIARFRDRDGLDQFVKRIQSYHFVERTETKLILNIIKETQPSL